MVVLQKYRKGFLCNPLPNMNFNYQSFFMQNPPFTLSRFSFRNLLLCFSLALSSALNAQTGLWSDPATWGGTLPAAGTTVTIGPGKTVILDVSPPALKGIQIQGNLVFADQNINLTTGYILVTGGEFRIGTETDRYEHKAIITFTGDIADVTGMGLGNKFLMVMGGGRLELHGARAGVPSWTQLKKTVSPGQTILETAESMGWRVGDKVVIAPSGTDAEQTEVRTIVEVIGHQIRVTPGLNFRHYGKVDTIHGYAIDMRAEIGLLTRDIVLQGDASSETSQNGGHVMVMNGSHAKVEGVEFFRMGWYGEQARYPMHWHFSGDSYGDYANNNSVHRSFHRAFVVHGTNGVKVNNNVAYNVFSHCYVVAEDGNEMFNEFVGNLGLMTKRIPDMDDFAFPGGQFSSLQSERHPGTFWLANPNNIVRDNHAAGSLDGIGFFYDGAGTAETVPANFFTGNIAHSNNSTEGSYDRAFYRTTGWGLFVGPGLGNGTTMFFNNFTGYKNTMGGAWLDGDLVTLRNSVLADNGSGVNIQGSSIQGVGLIHETANQIVPTTKNLGAINVFTSFDNGNKEPKIQDVDVIGFDKRIVIETDVVDIYSYARNIEFIGGSGPRIRIDRDDFLGAFIDLRGMVSGSGTPTVYFGEQYDFRTASCTADATANAYRCPSREYANLEISSNPYEVGPVGKVRLTRNIGSVIENMYESEVIADWLPEFGHRGTQWVPVNEGFQVGFTDEPMPQEFTLKLHGFSPSGNRFTFQVPSGKAPRLSREDGSLIPSNPSLASLNYAEDGWFFDEADNKLHLVMSIEPSGGFEKLMSIRLIPARMGVLDVASAEVMASPNPFQHQLTLQFEVAYDNVQTSIRLFDAEGKVAFEQPAQILQSGSHTLSFDGSQLAPGTYVYELRTGSKMQTGTVVRIQD